jgi:hypothetical protein
MLSDVIEMPGHQGPGMMLRWIGRVSFYGVFGLNALSTSVRSSDAGTWPVVA